jgi:hypothetical protein
LTQWFQGAEEMAVAVAAAVVTEAAVAMAGWLEEDSQFPDSECWNSLRIPASAQPEKRQA